MVEREGTSQTRGCHAKDSAEPVLSIFGGLFVSKSVYLEWRVEVRF